MDPLSLRKLGKHETKVMVAVFVLCLAFHFWGMTVGWQAKILTANEFREAQTAISSYWIDQTNDFSPAYPTPVLGKPWSVPMEFPLYQWTTVVVSRVTHWSLTKAGRAVGIGCFYLLLPAVYLLLARWRVKPRHRWMVLALVLTCPFYVFFARAVLMETMALMFSVWFWVAFERGVAGRSRAWVMLAMLAGTGAGLVKVTTFMLYLLPAGWWAMTRLWGQRRGEWRKELGWMAAAVIAPFAATLWWLHFADAVKAQNVLGVSLTSGALADFNLGTNATRFSAALWSEKLRIVGAQLTWLPLLPGCGAIAMLTRRRWRECAACLGWFSSVLLLFPVLYALHVYYYTANTLLLLLAMGLGLVALAESRVSRWLPGLALLLALGGQVYRYGVLYYPSQSAISRGGNGLTESLETVTKPDAVIVVLGQDWNSATPYYARRRAIMLRNDVARDAGLVEKALANLGETKIGALVIVGHRDGEQWLIDRCDARGIDPRPLYLWADARVYVPRARRGELTEVLLDHPFAGVTFAPGVELPKRDLANRWFDYAALRPWEQQVFAGMQPRPVRFFAQFGPGADGSSGQLMYGAHPVTRLVFALPAGAHVLKSSLQMRLDAYRLDLPDSEATDGVAVSLTALGPNEERRLLASRYFDPRHNREDRGERRPLRFDFTLPVAGEVELSFTPGPANRLTRDWIELGPLRIK